MNNAATITVNGTTYYWDDFAERYEDFGGKPLDEEN